MDEENSLSVGLLKINNEPNFSADTSEDNISRQTEQNADIVPPNPDGSHSTSTHDSDDLHSHETGSQKETSGRDTVETYSLTSGSPEKTPDLQGNLLETFVGSFFLSFPFSLLISNVE